jgi:hypothetical protein
MNIIKRHWTAENITQTLAALACGFLLVCVPVLTFKAIEHSSLNQPAWKSK